MKKNILAGICTVMFLGLPVLGMVYYPEVVLVLCVCFIIGLIFYGVFTMMRDLFN